MTMSRLLTVEEIQRVRELATNLASVLRARKQLTAAMEERYGPFTVVDAWDEDWLREARRVKEVSDRVLRDVELYEAIGVLPPVKL